MSPVDGFADARVINLSFPAVLKQTDARGYSRLILSVYYVICFEDL
jgi:hypothetical protein